MSCAALRVEFSVVATSGFELFKNAAAASVSLGRT